MVIESDKPLDQILRNKFERVDDSVPVSKPETEPDVEPVKVRRGHK